MVQYDDRLDRTFAALSDPTRRAILWRLRHGSATVGELAKPLPITLTGCAKHVRVLERAGLISTEKVGRRRRCSLGADGLQEVQDWIDDYRRALARRLDRLGELLGESEGERQ